MNGLSLFSGTAIGELAFKHILPDYRTVGYVDNDAYCQKVIRARIRDGILDDAPVFGDIRQFNERYASFYAGKVDWLSAGFPCQPFSVAGRQLGEDDERNCWPATRDTISIIRPRYVLLENVPGLLIHKYIGQIFGDLVEMRYDCEWDVIGASHVGAPHRRLRWWCLAYPSCQRRRGRDNGNAERGGGSLQAPGSCSADQPPILADTSNEGLPESTQAKLRSIREQEKSPKGSKSGRGNATTGDYWTTEPNVGRVAHGVAYRVDRLKALGNGWVPQVVRRILEVKT